MNVLSTHIFEIRIYSSKSQAQETQNKNRQVCIVGKGNKAKKLTTTDQKKTLVNFTPDSRCQEGMRGMMPGSLSGMHAFSGKQTRSLLCFEYQIYPEICIQHPWSEASDAILENVGNSGRWGLTGGVVSGDVPLKVQLVSGPILLHLST